MLDVASARVLLVTGHGKYYALDARCGHRGGPLEEGRLKTWDSTCTGENQKPVDKNQEEREKTHGFYSKQAFQSVFFCGLGCLR